MPALSPTMEEGKLVKWHVKEGDTVRSGDVIAEIETDKATMEVEAVDEGTMGRLLVAEGTEHVPVNHPIALLLTEDEGVIRDAHAARTGGETATFVYFDKDEEHIITGKVSFTGPGELPFHFSVLSAED